MEDETRLKEDWLVISDLHLCAGERLPDGRPNPHEFFKGDEGGDKTFRRMLRKFRQDAAGAEVIGLRLLGDIIDFHAIPFRGSFRYVPTEEAALEQLEQCIEGHQVFFQALADLIADPRGRVEWHIGNHDQDLAWPAVQERLRRRLDPHGTAGGRLTFVYERKDGDTWYFHGDILEPISEIPKGEDAFITAKSDIKPAVIAGVLLIFTYPALVAAAKSMFALDFRFELWQLLLALTGFLAFSSVLSWAVHKVYFLKWGNERRFLNAPTSTYMNSWLGQRLRTRKPWIGRMQNHGALWFLSLVHNWRFALVAFPMLVIYFYWHRFIVEPIDARRRKKRASFTMWETVRLLKSTTHEDRPHEMVRLIAGDEKSIRHFVCGHTHDPDIRKLKLSNGREVVYHNTGTGVQQVRVTLPEVECRTRHRRLESFFRRIAVYWKKRPLRALGLLGMHVLLAGLITWFGNWIGTYAGSTTAFFIAWMAIPIAVFSLFMRQSYAQYLAEEFTEFTPMRMRKTADGRKSFQHLKYLPKENTFSDFLDA